MSKVYDLIKEERKKRNLPNIFWSREMARLAQSQADYCARVGRLVHSNRYAFQGGENLWGGRGNPNPIGAVRGWMHSKAGHREYLLSSRIRKAGVGIARRNGFTCVAFAFSDASPSYPDCSYYRLKPVFNFKMPKIKIKLFGGKTMLRRPISLLVGLLGLWGIILGAHGLYSYCSGIELWFGGGDWDKLFLTFSVPSKLASSVLWMSEKAIQSWFIPASVFIGSWVVMSKSGLWDNISEILAKLRLW